MKTEKVLMYMQLIVGTMSIILMIYQLKKLSQTEKIIG